MKAFSQAGILSAGVWPGHTCKNQSVSLDTLDTPCLLPYLISQKSDQLFMVAKKHVKVAILKQQKSEHAEVETREERAQN